LIALARKLTLSQRKYQSQSGCRIAKPILRRSVIHPIGMKIIQPGVVRNELRRVRAKPKIKTLKGVSLNGSRTGCNSSGLVNLFGAHTQRSLAARDNAGLDECHPYRIAGQMEEAAIAA
jgi:hypothetical protein